jgi:mannose-6-phosphate isomerase-like protein (cupin superfamily)
VNLYAKEPTHIVLMVVAKAKDTSVAQAIEAMQKPGSVMWAKRSSPVMAVDTSGQPDVAWGGGAYHVHYGFEGGEGGAGASLEVLYTSKNAPITEHTHDKEWEAIAVIDGEGTLFKKGGDVNVAPGAMFSIPPGVSHGLKPAGTLPLLAIQMYAPPGPEQRFKKLAEAK